MGEISYKQIHQVSCGFVDISARGSLIDYSPYGYICCAVSGDVLLFNLNRYLKASENCTLRRDKALPDYYPDVRIRTADPVSWIAFNSDGLTLAIVTSSVSQGTFVNLVHLNNALKTSCSDLATICQPLRVCGGEPLSPDGQQGWELRDFGWSPAAPTSFAVILLCGAVRLFRATPCPSSETPQTLVNQLPSSVDALCLSWSGKGKQLAICLGGTLSTNSGVLQGPMILQVDPELHMKRVIQLNPTLTNYFPDSISISPIDLLWVSPACFILGLYRISATGQPEMRAALVHAPLKSTEVTWAEIPDLRGRPDSTKHCQYYFRAVGSGHFLASHSAGGEEFVLFAVPSASANVPLSSPSGVLTIELPPDGSPLGFCLGYFKQSPNAQSISYFLVSRLTNGCFSPYLLHNFDTISPPPSLLPASLDPPPALPTSVSSPSDKIPTPPNSCSISTQSVFPEESKHLTGPPKCSDTHGVTQEPLLFSFGKTSQPAVTLSLAASSQALTNAFNLTPVTTVSSSTTAATPVSVLSTSINSATSSNDLSSFTFPRSVQIASAQFTEALQSEAEAGCNAWSDLFNMMKNGHQTSDSETTTPAGVDAVEAKLLDAESFLHALDNVLQQLNEGSIERKHDLTNCAEYLDKLRRSLLMCAGGDFAPLLVDQLDPQAARWLARVKRKARLVESSLFDVDTQLEALSTEVESQLADFTPSLPTKRVGSKHSSLIEDKPSVNKLLHLLDTVNDLIRMERGRVEYLTETLKRMNVSSPDATMTPHSSFISTPGSRTHGRTVTKGASINPMYQRLSERDRFLYKLFANRKVPTVCAPKACPTLDDIAVDSSVDKPCVGDSLDAHAITRQHGESTDPRQLKLEKLLECSGSAASTNSPIKETSIPSDSTLHNPPPTNKLPSIHVATLSDRVHMCSSSNQPPSPKPILSVCSGGQVPSNAFGSFTLGQKAAFTSPASTATKNHIGPSDTASSVPASGTTFAQKAVSPLSVLSESSTTIPKAPSSMTPVFNFSSPSTVPLSSAETLSTSMPCKTTGDAPVVTMNTFTSPSLFSTATTTTANVPPVSSSGTSALMTSTIGSPFAVSSSVSSHSSQLSSTKSTTTSLFGTPTCGFSFGSNLFGPMTTSTLSTVATTSNSTTGGLFSFAQAAKPSGGLFGQNVPLFSAVQSTELKTPTLVSGSTSVSSSLPTFGGLFSSPPPVTSTTTCVPNVPITGSIGSIASSTTSAIVSSAPVSLVWSNSSVPSNLTFGSPNTTIAPLAPFTSSPSSVPATTTVDNSSLGKQVLGFGSNTHPTPTASATLSSGFFGAAPATSIGLTSPLTFGTATTTASVTSSGFTFKLPTTTSSTTTLPAGQPVAPTTTVSTTGTQQAFTNLFGMPTSSTGFGSNLFGSTTTNLSFGAPAATVVSATSATPPNTGAGLFQLPSAGSPFGQTASLFGQKATGPGTTSLFGVPSPTSTTAVTTSTNSTFMAGGLFSSLSTAQQNPPNAGLFSSSGTTQPTDVSNLFSGSSFGLGSTSPSNQAQGQNVFGGPFGSLGFGSSNQASAGLFSATPSTPQPGGGLFGAPVLSSNQPATSPTSGGLFGSQPNPPVTGGLFGTLSAQPASPLSAGGFGSSPVFGNSPFGTAASGQPAFGVAGAAAFGAPAAGGIFGGAPNTLTAPVASGTSFFGANNPTVGASGGGLFAALAAKTDSPTFGSLAMGSPAAAATPVVPASPFGASPSFTQRRA